MQTLAIVPYKFCVLSWNVRGGGVNDKDKRNVIRDFLRSNKTDLVCFQETKVQDIVYWCGAQLEG